MNKVKIENTQVFGFESALRGARNPMNSWDRSDSFTIYDSYDHRVEIKNTNEENFVLGDADKILAQKLTKAGSEHCKFLRQIHVWADFTLPRYIWSEMDTYHYNTKNSTSTMHKLMSRNLNLDDFTYNEFDEPMVKLIANHINQIRYVYGMTPDVKQKHEILRRAKQLLPEGYLQMRTMDTNYAELLNIYKQRWNHKLPEWHMLCEFIENLPYFVELTGIERKFTKGEINV